MCQACTISVLLTRLYLFSFMLGYMVFTFKQEGEVSGAGLRGSDLHPQNLPHHIKHGRLLRNLQGVALSYGWESPQQVEEAFRCDWHTLAFNMTGHTHSAGHTKAKALQKAPIPSYWINLPASVDRRKFMTAQLDMYGVQLGLAAHTRVEAISPKSPGYRVTKLEMPCKRNTETDIAVILSHLTAIYRAVKDTSAAAAKSPYALILEDDAAFHVKIDLRRVVENAPTDFGLLQLTTTNTEALSLLWNSFSESHNSVFWTGNAWDKTTANGKYTLYWGALGYIVNKKVVRDFIEDVVEEDEAGNLSFKIINSFNRNKCRRTKEHPCILANCLFSDSYIYSGAGPTYVARFPLLTSGSGSMGLNSTAHQTHVPAHIEAFKKIQLLLEQMRSRPRYLHCKHRMQQQQQQHARSPAA